MISANTEDSWLLVPGSGLQLKVHDLKAFEQSIQVVTSRWPTSGDVMTAKTQSVTLAAVIKEGSKVFVVYIFKVIIFSGLSDRHQLWDDQHLVATRL